LALSKVVQIAPELISRYDDILRGDFSVEEWFLPPREVALLTRHQLFFYLNQNLLDNQDAIFRQSAVLFRHMAMNRGIEGAALGYLSPTVLELITYQSCVHLESCQNLVTPGDVAHYTAGALAKFPYKTHEWHVEDNHIKNVPTGVLQIFHPITKRRLLNPFSTSQSTDVILANLESVSKATHLDEFMQNTATLVLFQYRYCARLIFGPCGSEHADSLEVKAYRQGHEFLQELSRTEPNLVVRPWPYLYESSSGNRHTEFYLMIFCGQGQDVVSEETAWGRLASGKTTFTSNGDGDGDQQPAIRRLNALIGQVNCWIKGPGSHHRSGQGGSRGYAATERHQRAMQSKKLIRERFSRELKHLSNAANKCGHSARPAIRTAQSLAKKVLNK